MKTYQVQSPEEYKNALMDIIQNKTTGIIEVNSETFSTETYQHSVFELSDDICVIYSKCSYKNLQKTNDLANLVNLLDINELNSMKLTGIYANQHFYKAGFALKPYYKEYEQTLPVRETEKIATTINQKITDYIIQTITERYPNNESIPEHQRFNKKTDHPEEYRQDIINDANQAILTNQEDKETPNWNIDIKPTIKDIILYDRAVANHKEEKYIREKTEAYLNEKSAYGTSQNDWTNRDTLLYRLSRFYLTREEIKRIKENMNPEYVIFLKIKQGLDALLETTEAKKVKVYINGKDSMVSPYKLKKYENFSIEGKIVETTCEPRHMLNDYAHNQRFSSWNLDIVSPKIKERYSNRNERYLEDIQPSDIQRITYGKTVLYQKDEA